MLSLRRLRVLSRSFCNQNFSIDKPATVTEGYGSKWITPCGPRTKINIYNPILKQKVPFYLSNDSVIHWYACGPTVYNSCHIGHACTYVKLDIIRRIMTNVFDLNIVFAMGITDIDDKIINQSNKTRKKWENLAKRYTDEFFLDMRLLNVQSPNITCKVSDHIPHIIRFIKEIISKNGAYVGTDGSVYFNTSAYEDYGKLQPLQEEQFNDNRSTRDFVLWKAAKKDEPFWSSPWGPGRPGWHIECSAMASAIFGDNIDVHSGGKDLLFPHHENEEAQSCCYHNVRQWINYWIHTGLLNLEGTKMSKSLENIITVPEFLRTNTANHLRMICLLSHYRNNITYSVDVVKKAVALSDKITYFLSDCNNYMNNNNIKGISEDGNIDPETLRAFLEKTKRTVYYHFTDDFNTPEAMHQISKLITITRQLMNSERKDLDNTRYLSSVSAVYNYVQSIMSKLGLSVSEKRETIDATQILHLLVDFRHWFRNKALEGDNIDFESLKACDELRHNLHSLGIYIRDQGGKSYVTFNK